MKTMSGPAGSAFGLSRIGQIALPVRDLGRAITFYRDTLGIRFLFQAPPSLAFFDCDGVRLLVEQPQDQEFHKHSSVLYFSISAWTTYGLCLRRWVLVE